jgi:hypothetical protein
MKDDTGKNSSVYNISKIRSVMQITYEEEQGNKGRKELETRREYFAIRLADTSRISARLKRNIMHMWICCRIS